MNTRNGVGCVCISQTSILLYKLDTDKLTAPFESNYHKIQKHFHNVMLVGRASKISKNYTYKCVDRSRHKGAKAKCAH